MPRLLNLLFKFFMIVPIGLAPIFLSSASFKQCWAAYSPSHMPSCFSCISFVSAVFSALFWTLFTCLTFNHILMFKIGITLSRKHCLTSPHQVFSHYPMNYFILFVFVSPASSMVPVIQCMSIEWRNPKG